MGLGGDFNAEVGCKGIGDADCLGEYAHGCRNRSGHQVAEWAKGEALRFWKPFILEMIVILGTAHTMGAGISYIMFCVVQGIVLNLKEGGSPSHPFHLSVRMGKGPSPLMGIGFGLGCSEPLRGEVCGDNPSPNPLLAKMEVVETHSLRPPFPGRFPPATMLRRFGGGSGAREGGCLASEFPKSTLQQGWG